MIFLRGSSKRTLLSGLGVVCGVSLYLSIHLINQATLAAFRENARSLAGKATLAVTAEGGGFSEGVLEQVARIPGVRHAVPMTENVAYYAQNSLHVLGIDLLKEQAVRTYKTGEDEVIDDPLVFLNQPDSIILTHEFARQNGFKLDSPIELLTAAGKKKFIVRGLLHPQGPAKAFGGAIAIMDLDAQRLAFGKEGRLDRIDVVPKEGADSAEIARNLKTQLGAGFSVNPPDAQSAGLEKMVQPFQGMLSFLSSLALLIGLFLVANSVAISVAERRQQIGTLRAIGATRTRVLSLFLAENALLGLAASSVGVVLGKGLADALLASVVRAMNGQYASHFSVTRIPLSFGDIVATVVFGTSTCLLAAIWPAYRATRVSPLETFRPEAARADQASRFWSVSPKIGLALLVYLSVVARFDLAAESRSLESVHLFSGIVAAALLAPPAILAAVRLLRRFFDFERFPILRLSIENILRAPSRTASNTLALTVGLVLVVVISGVAGSFQLTIENWSRRGMSQTDLMVTSQGRWTQMQIQPLHESLMAELEKVEGVMPIKEGGVFGVRILNIPYEGKTVAIKSLDPPAPGKTISFLDAVSASSEALGAQLFSESPDGAAPLLMSDHFSRNFGKKVGDSVELPTPSGPRTFRIRGIVRDFVNPEGVLYLSRVTFRKLWQDALIDLFSIRVRPGFAPETVRQNIDQALGRSKGISVIKSAEAVEDLRKNVEQSFAFNHAIEFAALVVGLLGLLNTMLLSVMERRREFAMLRAIGTSRTQLARMVFLDCLLQGFLGAGVAVVLGTFVSYLWVKSSLSHVLGWVFDFYLPWEAALVALGAGTTVAVLAGLLPALQASRVPVIEALRAE